MPTDTRDFNSSHVSLFCPTMDDLSDELYQLVVRGGVTELKSRLSELPNAVEYLTALRQYREGRLSLLMVAALHGHDEIVCFFLTCDPSNEQLKLRGIILDQDQPMMCGVSALYCACYRRHFHVAKTLIELGKANANEDTWDYHFYPLLLHASMNNRLDIVRFLLENRYADVNETKSLDHLQFTALICAARDGHISLVQYLIDFGADVNYSSPKSYLDARTALMFALEKDHLDIFVLLYRRGATINPSLLTTAITNKSHSILRFLLDESLITFNLFKGRSLKMNEKITAAWINIFSVYFDVSADFAAIFKKYTAQVNEKDEFSLQRTETQAQPRDVTQMEREIKVERTMRRATEKQAVRWVQIEKEKTSSCRNTRRGTA